MYITSYQVEINMKQDVFEKINKFEDLYKTYQPLMSMELDRYNEYVEKLMELDITIDLIVLCIQNNFDREDITKEIIYDILINGTTTFISYYEAD